MKRYDAEKEAARQAHLEKVMYSTWLRESGETNADQIRHLKNCVRIALAECLTETQLRYISLYLSGYSSTEIANICGVNKATVSRGMHRGLKKVLSRIKYATPRTLEAGDRVRGSLVRLYK